MTQMEILGPARSHSDDYLLDIRTENQCSVGTLPG